MDQDDEQLFQQMCPNLGMGPGDAQHQQLQQVLQEPLAMDPQDVPQQPLQDLHQQIHQELAGIDANLNYFENRIPEIKQNARQQFTIFNGQNFQPIDFGYILNYRHLRHQLDETRNAFLAIVNHWNNLAPEQPDFQQELGQIQRLLNRITADLDDLRDFLIIGGYAHEEQLNQGALLNQYPWRFRYQENPQHWSDACFQMIDHLLIHAPQQVDYNNLQPQAQHSLEVFQEMTEEQQNDPAQTTPLFAYIRSYRELAKRVKKMRVMVEDIFELLWRVISALNWEENGEQNQMYLEYRNRLRTTLGWYREGGQWMVDRQYATWDQLNFGLVEGHELPLIFENELVHEMDDGSATETAGSEDEMADGSTTETADGSATETAGSEGKMDDGGGTTESLGSSEDEMDDGGGTTEPFSD